MKSIFILVIYFVFILNGYIEYKFMIKIVIPRPERVYGMCNHRVAYVCTRGFLNYLSAKVIFLKVVLKDEIVKFSKHCCTFSIKESRGVKVQIMGFQNDNNNNKFP